MAAPLSGAEARPRIGSRHGEVPVRPRADRLRPLHLLGKLAVAETRPAVVAGETLLLPLIAVALGMLFSSGDPLFTAGPFPWPWLAALVLALRYGPMAGLGGACVLLAAWLLLHPGHSGQFPQMYFLGGLILVMLAGEFSSLWRARTRRAETLQRYLDQRLDYLVRQHYLLRLSHDRMEQELIGRPMSMRDALTTLRDAGRGGQDGAQAPAVLLRLLAQYCQLEAAGLFAVAHGLPGSEPIAAIGAGTALHPQDPMLQQALQTGRLCHISQSVHTRQDSRYLVVAPLLDLGGEPYGVLVVADMPFFALQRENLYTLQLLLGYYTDGLSMHTLAEPLLEAFPQCPALFAFETQRLARIGATTGVPSVIVALELNERAVQQGLAQPLQRLKRELDETWLIDAGTRHVLAVLMPLGNEATAEGYVARLQGWSRQRNHQSLAEAGIFPHVLPLDLGAPERTLRQLLAIAHA